MGKLYIYFLTPVIACSRYLICLNLILQLNEPFEEQHEMCLINKVKIDLIKDDVNCLAIW